MQTSLARQDNELHYRKDHGLETAIDRRNGEHKDMKPQFRLTVYQSGTVARLPVQITEETLEEALLVASFFDATKVAAILDCAKRIGVAEYTEGADRPVYVVERLDDVDQRQWPVLPGPSSRHMPDKPIWRLNVQ